IYGAEETDHSHCPRGGLVLWRNHNNNRLFSPKTIQSLSNYYTAYFGPVVADDCTDIIELGQVFAAALWSDRRQWDVLNLRPLDQQSPMFASLVTAFRQAGIISQTYFCFGNWYLDVAGRSYAEYFKSLPNVLRKNVPYMWRKLQKTAHVRIEIYTGEDGLEQALDDYETVYNTSWRERESHPAFVRGLARMAMEQGWLRLGLLYVDNKPAAAQLWIVHKNVASIYKICYAEQFAKLSVGSILTAHLMEYVIDIDKVKEVDYLS